MATPLIVRTELAAHRRQAISEQGANISAMLARWRSEDVSDEPDWDIEDIEPLSLRDERGRDVRRP